MSKTFLEDAVLDMFFYISTFRLAVLGRHVYIQASIALKMHFDL